jgi:hypothetical protein
MGRRASKEHPLKSEQTLMRVWAAVPIGTQVIVQRDTGDLYSTTTRSAPFLSECGMAMIQVDGIAGCYWLKRVKRVVSFP